MFSHEANVLKTASEAIAEAYARKTGKSMAQLAKMMDAETWMNARQAKEAGFIDEIIETIDNRKTATLINAAGPMLSDETIEKLRKQIKLGASPEDGEALISAKKKAQASLELLKMKGELNV